MYAHPAFPFVLHNDTTIVSSQNLETTISDLVNFL